MSQQKGTVHDIAVKGFGEGTNDLVSPKGPLHTFVAWRSVFDLPGTPLPACFGVEDCEGEEGYLAG